MIVFLSFIIILIKRHEVLSGIGVEVGVVAGVGVELKDSLGEMVQFSDY